MKPTKSEELAKSTLEVLSLKTKYYHSDQRVALQLLHASDPRSDDLSKKKRTQAPRRRPVQKATKKLLKDNEKRLLGPDHRTSTIRNLTESVQQNDRLAGFSKKKKKIETKKAPLHSSDYNTAYTTLSVLITCYRQHAQLSHTRLAT